MQFHFNHVFSAKGRSKQSPTRNCQHMHTLRIWRGEHDPKVYKTPDHEAVTHVAITLQFRLQLPSNCRGAGEYSKVYWCIYWNQTKLRSHNVECICLWYILDSSDRRERDSQFFICLERCWNTDMSSSHAQSLWRYSYLVMELFCTQEPELVLNSVILLMYSPWEIALSSILLIRVLFLSIRLWTIASYSYFIFSCIPAYTNQIRRIY